MQESFTSASADHPSPRSYPWIAEGFAFGGDYSPEQWPEEVWAEDIELMRRAGVNSVNLAVFSWGLLEVADGVFEWGWLDRAMDLLHAGGVGVNLATPTAAPPMWLWDAHPEIATVDEFGNRTHRGGRLGWSPSSPVFREYALRMVRALAERYGQHPALRLWHVSNEIGNENARCYGEDTERAWQSWLAERFGTIDELNQAWGTTFWGHHYTSFDQVMPPRHARTGHNPGLLLDFERFTSDALLGHYLAERAVLREVTPDIPITTNFMVMGSPSTADYGRWAREVDLVANDHYTQGADPEREGELSFSADRVRGMAGGRPWLLIEHSTSAVNWQRVNRAKSRGELARNSLAHVARGADGALFFQWRASTAGAEQFHSAMVPHAGSDSRIFREVTDLGATLKALAPARGSVVVPARVALLVDQDSAWAWRSGKKPHHDLGYFDLPLAFHREFTARHIAVDVIAPGALDQYDLVVVPTLYLASEETADALRAVVARGGHVVVSYLSGIVDPNNRVVGGGYPGLLRDLLGVRVEEHYPLFDDEVVALDSGATAASWTERVELRGAEALVRFVDGELAGEAALTRIAAGAGTATYLAARLDRAGLGALVENLVALAGVHPVVDADAGLEVTRRVSDSASYLFLINHADAERTARASGTDLVSGATYNGAVVVPAGAVVVLEESR
jgi:beta-galactosidase